MPIIIFFCSFFLSFEHLITWLCSADIRTQRQRRHHSAFDGALPVHQRDCVWDCVWQEVSAGWRPVAVGAIRAALAVLGETVLFQARQGVGEAVRARCPVSLAAVEKRRSQAWGFGMRLACVEPACKRDMYNMCTCTNMPGCCLGTCTRRTACNGAYVLCAHVPEVLTRRDVALICPYDDSKDVGFFYFPFVQS